MANYTVFGASAPTVTASGDTSPVNVGTAFYVVNDVTGWRAAGARFYVPSTTSMPTSGYKAYLWQGQNAATATLLATANFPTLTAGWNEVLFPTATPLASFPTDGSYYWVSVYFPGGRYAAKASAFSDSVVSTNTANLLAAANLEVLPSNSAFTYGTAGQNLTGNSSGTWYAVDVIVDDGITDNPNATSATGASAFSISDSVSAVRTGGPSSTTATAKATDPLGASDTQISSLPMGGTSLRTVRRSMWEDRISMSSMQYVESTFGPDYTSAEPNELGVEFSVAEPMTIVGANIYKSPEAAGTIPLTLWSQSGEIMARATVTWAVDEGGWREVLFTSPVSVSAGARYVMSYHAANGKWCQNIWVYNGMDYFEWPFFVERYLETATGKTGASRVGGTIGSANVYPTIVLPHNYFVDPIAEWVETTPAAGPGYYDQFPNGGSSFGVPMGVFYPDPPWLEDYMSIGVNTACGVPINVPGYRAAIAASGMDVYASSDDGVATQESVLSDPGMAASVKGYFLWDEPDMVHNGGTPDQLWARLANIRSVDSTRPIVLNLGKWPSESISFQWWPVGATVNTVTANWYEYGKIPDIISCDSYSITRPRYGIWAYTKQIQKMRQLSHGRLPIWGLVESCPVEESNPSPEQVDRASWACFIAGATGIIFFDHRFASLTQTQDFASMLHTPNMRAGVQALCAQVQALAGPINAAPLALVTKVESSNKTAGPLGGTYGVPIQQTSRADGAYRYVFAQANRPGATTGTFTVPSAAGKTITVLNEGRTLTANASGVFTDSFADGDYTYHLYRWTA